MKLSELTVDRLPITDTNNEQQSRLMEQLQLQNIDIESYEFENKEERELQANAGCRHKFVAILYDGENASSEPDDIC